MTALLAPPDKARYVVILAAPGSQVLDVTGPFQVFARANEISVARNPRTAPPYILEVVNTTAGKVTTCCGMELQSHRCITHVSQQIDTLLVAGGTDIEEGRTETRVIEWFRTVSKSARRVGSICTGAFLLAQAGLLNQRPATTHWKYCDQLSQKYPSIQVKADRIYIRDGNIYTSAGVTAGMDLALALVEEDLGPVIALQVARELVLYLRRPGGQSQFSAALMAQSSDKEPFRDLGAWILEHLTDDLSMDALARHVYMSPRNFFRVFSAEFGITPGKFVERMRVEAARRRLLESKASIEMIAAECGFRSADVMRCVFKRALNTSPKEYRQRFSTPRDLGRPEEPR